MTLSLSVRRRRDADATVNWIQQVRYVYDFTTEEVVVASRSAGSILIGDHYKMLLLAHSKLFTYLTARPLFAFVPDSFICTVLLTHIFGLNNHQAGGGWYGGRVHGRVPNWIQF